MNFFCSIVIILSNCEETMNNNKKDYDFFNKNYEGHKKTNSTLIDYLKNT